jgi:hypothetical protein
MGDNGGGFDLLDVGGMSVVLARYVLCADTSDDGISMCGWN